MNSLPDTQIVLQILLSVGIIVIAAKYLGVRAKKIGIPQVAGEIVAGLLFRGFPITAAQSRTSSTAKSIILFRIWRKSASF